MTHASTIETAIKALSDTSVAPDAQALVRRAMDDSARSDEDAFNLLKSAVIACGALGSHGTRAAHALQALNEYSWKPLTAEQKSLLATEMALTIQARTTRVLKRGDSTLIRRALWNTIHAQDIGDALKEKIQTEWPSKNCPQKGILWKNIGPFDGGRNGDFSRLNAIIAARRLCQPTFSY